VSDRYVTLMGAEEVSAAGRSMQSAATEMRNAAATISDALYQHQQFMTDWLARLEQALQESRKP
jgi:Sec-independent protein translocase protein TatA